MPARSEAEGALRDATLAALNHGGQNPWGPVGRALARAAGLEAKFARAIGMQENSVIDRAITSMGMAKAHLRVHGFVAYPETAVENAVERLTQEIQRLPYLRTAVLIPASNNYYPSHVISREPAVAKQLAAEYPNASVRDDLQFQGVPEQPAGGGAEVHSGPWMIEAALPATARTLAVPADARFARMLSPGDHVLLTATSGEGERRAYAVAIVSALARSDADFVLELHPIRIFDEPVPAPEGRA
jgi:hypothetical protein